jgi:hypothetical protein
VTRCDGAVWIDIGRLRLIWCAPNRLSTPGHPEIPGHPNKWMIVWRRQLPERDPKTKWAGNERPGPYWKGCDARLQRKRGVDPEDARCRFPRCDCANISEDAKREWWTRVSQRLAYRDEWVRRLRAERSEAHRD